MTYKGLRKTPEDMLFEFDNGQLPELYHIIYVAMYPGEFSLSEHGYAFKNSQNISTKICAVASYW